MTAKMQKVQVIAGLFIIMGFLSALDSYNALMNEGVLSVGLELILLPAGVGLLKKSERWRRISINLTLIFVIIALIQPVLVLMIGPAIHVSLLGRTFAPNSVMAVAYMLTYSGVFLAAMYWIFQGLHDSEVKEAFSESQESPGGSNS